MICLRFIVQLKNLKMTKKINIEAKIDEEGNVFFSIQRSEDITPIEIMGLIEHINFELADSLKKKFKAAKV